MCEGIRYSEGGVGYLMASPTVSWVWLPSAWTKRGITAGKASGLRFAGVWRTFGFGFTRYMWYGGHLVVASSSGLSLSFDLILIFYLLDSTWLICSGWSSIPFVVSWWMHWMLPYHAYTLSFLGWKRQRPCGIRGTTIFFGLRAFLFLKFWYLHITLEYMLLSLVRKHFVITKAKRNALRFPLETSESPGDVYITNIYLTRKQENRKTDT